jgi:hypothetical protein
MLMPFEVISEINEIETFTVGSKIWELNRLQETYGKGRWRKCKGTAIKLTDTSLFLAELHWYEAKGIGKKELKIKSLLEKIQ